MYVKPSQNYSTFRATKIENIALKQGVQVMRVFFDFAACNMGTISISETKSTATNDFSSTNSVKIYPNPVVDKLFILSEKPIENYRIQTLTGQTILKGSMINNQFVDLRKLIKGNYLVCFQGKDFVKTEKFIKL